MTKHEQTAIKRLMGLAQQGDSGQSRIIADFLLAWWNAEECGGFDLTGLWRVEPSIAQDMVTVVGFIASSHKYADTLGYDKEFKSILRDWRPQL